MCVNMHGRKGKRKGIEIKLSSLNSGADQKTLSNGLMSDWRESGFILFTLFFFEISWLVLVCWC